MWVWIPAVLMNFFFSVFSHGVEPPNLTMVFTEGRLIVNEVAVENDLQIGDLRKRLFKSDDLGVITNDFGYHSMLDTRLVFCMGTDKQVFLVGARMKDVADGKATVSINGKLVQGDATIAAMAEMFGGQVYDLGGRRKEILTDVPTISFVLNVDGKSIDYVMFQVTSKGSKPAP
jgi:hypothetical protein